MIMLCTATLVYFGKIKGCINSATAMCSMELNWLGSYRSLDGYKAVALMIAQLSGASTITQITIM